MKYEFIPLISTNFSTLEKHTKHYTIKNVYLSFLHIL